MNNAYINSKNLHIIAWVFYFFLLTASFSGVSGIELALYRATQTVIIYSFLFYTNTLVLMPKLFEKSRYFLYFVFLFFLVFFTVWIIYSLNIHFNPFGDMISIGRGFGSDPNPDFSGRLGGKEANPSIMITRSIMRNFSSVLAIVLLSIVLRMFSQKLAKEKREAALSHEHLLSEMKFLKSQVNPHFLFNALNNIYALVHLKHDNASAMLIKLSNMLRYMLYECNDELVPLQREIDYITNYIELQQLKTERPQNIKFVFDEVDTNVLIPPLLLVPLVENSFKHSSIEDVLLGWVDINLSTTADHIKFSIFNSLPATSIVKDETGGIGLENVRKRLCLLFLDEHNLIINSTANEFQASLKINRK
jgi:two-component system, LytTR family, sensor kinase